MQSAAIVGFLLVSVHQIAGHEYGDKPKSSLEHGLLRIRKVEPESGRNGVHLQELLINPNYLETILDGSQEQTVRVEESNGFKIPPDLLEYHTGETKSFLWPKTPMERTKWKPDSRKESEHLHKIIPILGEYKPPYKESVTRSDFDISKLINMVSKLKYILPASRSGFGREKFKVKSYNAQDDNPGLRNTIRDFMPLNGKRTARSTAEDEALQISLQKVMAQIHEKQNKSEVGGVSSSTIRPKLFFLTPSGSGVSDTSEGMRKEGSHSLKRFAHKEEEAELMQEVSPAKKDKVEMKVELKINLSENGEESVASNNSSNTPEVEIGNEVGLYQRDSDESVILQKRHQEDAPQEAKSRRLGDGLAPRSYDFTTTSEAPSITEPTVISNEIGDRLTTVLGSWTSSTTTITPLPIQEDNNLSQSLTEGIKKAVKELIKEESEENDTDETYESIDEKDRNLEKYLPKEGGNESEQKLIKAIRQYLKQPDLTEKLKITKANSLTDFELFLEVLKRLKMMNILQESKLSGLTAFYMTFMNSIREAEDEDVSYGSWAPDFIFPSLMEYLSNLDGDFVRRGLNAKMALLSNGLKDTTRAATSTLEKLLDAVK